MFSVDNLVLMGIFAVVSVLQLLLCFLGKRLWIRLLPVAVFFCAGVGFLIFVPLTEGWTALGCLLLALLAFAFSVCCGVCWGVWGIVKAISKHCKNKER